MLPVYFSSMAVYLVILKFVFLFFIHLFLQIAFSIPVTSNLLMFISLTIFILLHKILFVSDLTFLHCVFIV
jgi:hypothetical protein